MPGTDDICSRPCQRWEARYLRKYSGSALATGPVASGEHITAAAGLLSGCSGPSSGRCSAALARRDMPQWRSLPSLAPLLRPRSVSRPAAAAVQQLALRQVGHALASGHLQSGAAVLSSMEVQEAASRNISITSDAACMCYCQDTCTQPSHACMYIMAFVGLRCVANATHCKQILTGSDCREKTSTQDICCPAMSTSTAAAKHRAPAKATTDSGRDALWYSRPMNTACCCAMCMFPTVSTMMYNSIMRPWLQKHTRVVL